MASFLLYNPNTPPFGAIALALQCQAIQGAKQVKMATKANETQISLRIGTELVLGYAHAVKYYARVLTQLTSQALYPADPLAAAQIDQLCVVAETLTHTVNKDTLTVLNEFVAARTYLVGHDVTAADWAVWGALLGNAEWKKLSADAATQAAFPHVFRWFALIDSLPAARAANPSADDLAAKAAQKKKQDAGGSFDIGLDKAQLDGKVVTRFPPEPSGYMHIGHAKAALLNHHYAREYNGKLILRFDDTNPTKEKEEFVDNILSDLQTLGVKWDVLSHTSDFFDDILKHGEQMLRTGKAYIDDTPVDLMREERSAKKDSRCRNQTVEENLRRWNEMIKGSAEGLTCCMRAKIDMCSENGCLRDPTLFRCNLTPHHKTGDKYKVYPTYDFACPIVDSVEGVTHAMRTNEYHDRNAQYMWVLDALNLRKPTILDFSRMNLVYTTLSKRKLTWFVQEGLVKGWNDPRFPTVQGILRRGLVVPALKEFILKQGFSKATNNMEWDAIWSTNKKHIDPTAHRYVAVSNEFIVPFHLSNFDGAETQQILLHPKNEGLGKRVMGLGSTIYLEQDDAILIEANEEVTLMRWGNAIIERIEKNEQGKVTALHGRLNLAGDFTTTKKKITFVAARPDVAKVRLIEVDHLLCKAKLTEEDSFDDYVTKQSWFETEAVADASISAIQPGQIIQLERRGYFICDEKPADPSQPLALLFIPDGRATGMSTLSSKMVYKLK